MNKFFFYLFIVATFIQCKEPYDFETTATENSLIIEGGINDLDGPYSIKLSKTINSKRRPDPVTGAIVSISDDTNNNEIGQETFGGVYQFAGNNIRATQGRKYTLKVVLSDGRTYTSTPEMLPEANISEDRLYTAILQENLLNGVENKVVLSWRINANLDFNLPQTKSNGFYRWDLKEVYSVFPTCFPGAISCPSICYVTEVNSFNLIIIDPKNYSGKKISNLLLQDRSIDFSFDSRHYYVATQNVINQQAYQYWIKVQDLLSKKGSIFDTPPYLIVGNMRNVNDPSEIVLGYFEVAKQKISRTFIDRRLIPIPVQTCQFYSPDFDLKNLQGYCFNCMTLEGSSSVEPDWFW